MWLHDYIPNWHAEGHSLTMELMYMLLYHHSHHSAFDSVTLFSSLQPVTENGLPRCYKTPVPSITVRVTATAVVKPMWKVRD